MWRQGLPTGRDTPGAADFMDNPIIDPKALIAELGVAGLNRYSDEYYKRLYDANIQLGKPFSMFQHTPQLLVRLGLMLESLRISPGIKILDFGAGTCWVSKALWQMGCSVIATDVSEEALRLGRSLFTDYPIPNKPPCSWETRLFDGHRLPVEDEEVDRIICFDAFHHVPNPEDTIKEFFRVLRNGGTIVFNEPLGPHSTTPDSQREMRDYRVLENDLDMAALAPLFVEAGFDPPTFKVAANPDYMMTHEEWSAAKSGEAPPSLLRAISEFQQNSGVFYFQKGKPLNDSRQSEGLAHELEVPADKLVFKSGQPQSINVSFRNTGENRWLDKNEHHIGVVHFASRVLHYETKEILIDNSRFRIPGEMEPGDSFSGEVSVPIAWNQPGRYWLKFDLVSEGVCWFESLGSKATLVEIEIEG